MDDIEQAIDAELQPQGQLVAQTVPEAIRPTLQNVVATVSLGCRLELRKIAMEARNAEYNPKVVTGAKGEEEAKQATRKDFQIQNMVGRADVGFPIRLEGINVQHNLFCSYEPELFPGLVYHMKDPKVVLLIFVTGKVVITGAKKREDIDRAFSSIYPVLVNFKKGDAYVPTTKRKKASQAQQQQAGEANKRRKGGRKVGPQHASYQQQQQQKQQQQHQLPGADDDDDDDGDT